MHPWEFHPALVHFPMALLLSAVALDLYALRDPREILTRTAAGLYVAGLASGALAGAAGVLAWFTAPHADEAHALMIWHPVLAVMSLIAFAVVALRRWKRRAQPAPRPLWVLGLVGAILLLSAGTLGGRLVYHAGAGVVAPGFPRAGGHGHGEEGGPRPPSAEDVLKDGGREGRRH